MRVLAIIHHRVAGPGVFADVVRERGHQLEVWIPSEREIPRPLGEYGAVLAFGGGMHPQEDDLHPWLLTVLATLRSCIDAEVPTLGICLGGQLLARAAGGPVRPALQPETGWRTVELTDDGLSDPLFQGMLRRFEVFQWHSYEFGVPPRGVLLAQSEISPQCFRVGDCAWGLQWHPEVRAESIVHWAEHYRPSPGGVPIELDGEALRVEVAARIQGTNADGRGLCGRFLTVAEANAAR